MIEPPKPVAVALRYKKGDRAPVVVASGRGHIGQKIIDVAREHGVPLEQNPALAAALSTIALEDEIPEPLFKAVAEILGFIMRAAGPGEPSPPR